MADANGIQVSSAGVVPAAAEATPENRNGEGAPNQLLFNAGTRFGGLVSSMEMNDAVEMACGELGIPAGVSFDGVTLQELGQDPRTAGIVAALSQDRVLRTFPLAHIQAVAVSRLVYMPKRRLECTQDEFTPEIFKSPESDIGSLAVNDNPTGTGKTIVSMLGAVMFCAMRGGDMAETLRLQQECHMRSSPTSVLKQSTLDAWPQAGAGRRCVVFVAGHLVGQWIDQANIVKEIIREVPGIDEWKVTVTKGSKNDHADVLEEKEVHVYVCSLKTPGLRPGAYLEASTYYSALVFDECGETAPFVNGMLCTMPKGVQYGKLISCSADLSPWKNSGWSGINPHKNTVFRHVFPEWSRYSDSCDTKATAYASAIFTPAERQWVMTECANTLRDIFIFTASVKYTPSLLERVGVGYGVDLGKKSGHELFHDIYKVDISKCKTHQEIKDSIQLGICRLDMSIRAGEKASVYQIQRMQKERDLLVKLLPRVACLPDETCCICLGPMESASLLQPCMHSICSSLCAEDLEKANMSCPTCRGKIGSKVIVDVVHGHVPAMDVENKPSKKPRLESETGSTSAASVALYPRVATTAAEAALEEIRISCGPSPPTGVAEAVRMTLLSVKGARKRTDRNRDTLLVMVIIPGVDVREGLFDGLGFDDVMYHRSKGYADDKVYQARVRAQLKKFERKDGKSKILFVRDGHTDCMTGLDIEGLDAVISVGKGNFAQRLGRLCRFSRSRLPEEKKHALYVEITPR